MSGTKRQRKQREGHVVLNKKGPEEVVVGSGQGENRLEMCLETTGSRGDNLGEKRKWNGGNVCERSRFRSVTEKPRLMWSRAME